MPRDAEYEIIRARKFELVDEAGNMRAAMGPGPRGAAGVQFYDKQGTPKIEMSVSEDGSGSLTLRDKSGNITASTFTDDPRISLTYIDQGSEESWGVEMSIIGKEGEFQAPGVTLAKDGQPRLYVSLTEGVPFIHTRDEQGQRVARQVGLPDD
jgi:hypothetical protein